MSFIPRVKFQLTASYCIMLRVDGEGGDLAVIAC